MYKPSPLFLEILQDAKRAGHQPNELEKEILKRGKILERETEMRHPDEEVGT